MLSSSNLGQSGPHAHHPGFGSQLSSLAGFTNLTGYRDGSPQILYGPYIDYIAVGYGVVAVLAALEYREATGRGQHIDLAQYETGLQYLAPLLLDYTVNGNIAVRDGNRHPEAVPHGAFPCAGDDNWCVLSVASDEQWRALCQAMDRPEWGGRDEYATAERRRKRADELETHIGEWTRQFEARELVEKLQAAGVPSGVVNGMDQVYDDPQLVHRNQWNRMDHPGDRHHVVPARALYPVRKRRRPGPTRPAAGRAQRLFLPRAVGALGGGVRLADARGGHRLSLLRNSYEHVTTADIPNGPRRLPRLASSPVLA